MQKTVLKSMKFFIRHIFPECFEYLLYPITAAATEPPTVNNILSLLFFLLYFFFSLLFWKLYFLLLLFLPWLFKFLDFIAAT